MLVLENSLNWVGFDYVLFVKVVIIVVVVKFLGGGREEIKNVFLNVWIDNVVLRIYCYLLNIGLCKLWVVGDVMSRGVYLVLMLLKGEMGYLIVLSVLGWGF